MIKYKSVLKNTSMELLVIWKMPMICNIQWNNAKNFNVYLVSSNLVKMQAYRERLEGNTIQPRVICLISERYDS